MLDKEDQDDDDGDAEHERGRLKQWSPIARLGGLLVLLLTQLALTDSLPASSWLIRFICFVALFKGKSQQNPHHFVVETKVCLRSDCWTAGIGRFVWAGVKKMKSCSLFWFVSTEWSFSVPTGSCYMVFPSSLNLSLILQPWQPWLGARVFQKRTFSEKNKCNPVRTPPGHI